jgi:hypothetical protein
MLFSFRPRGGGLVSSKWAETRGRRVARRVPVTFILNEEWESLGVLRLRCGVYFLRFARAYLIELRAQLTMVGKAE